MLKKYPKFTFAFAIIFFAELVAIGGNINELRWITKPLIAISLILFLHFTITQKNRFTRKVIAGLVFSLIGDIFLLLPNGGQSYFMLGLGAFLIAHLLYISAFYSDSKNKTEVQNRYVLPIFMLFGAFCLSYYYLLRPHLGTMNIPVLVYSFVITIMGVMAALRYGKTNANSFIWILVGAILFITSDSILAYNKFVATVSGADLMIMSTYMLAQFLITIGTAEREHLKNS